MSGSPGIVYQTSRSIRYIVAKYIFLVRKSRFRPSYMSPGPRVPFFFFSRKSWFSPSHTSPNPRVPDYLRNLTVRNLTYLVITLNGGGTKLREESLPTPRFTPAVFLQGLRGLDQTRISRARHDNLWWNKVEQNWYFASMVTHKRHFRRAGGSLTDRPSLLVRWTMHLFFFSLLFLWDVWQWEHTN